MMSWKKIKTVTTMMFPKKMKAVTRMMSDLPEDLVEEILSRVPLICLRAVRSTCKQWNDLSKDRFLCKSEARQRFLGFTLVDFKICSFRIELHGDSKFVKTSIKRIDKFIHVNIHHVFHSGGLLLLETRETNTRLVVWNPYLGQTKWIQSRSCYGTFAFGHDNKHNHKILNMAPRNNEIFDFKSNSWRVLDIILKWFILPHQQYVSLKGNSYFFAQAQRDEINKGQGPLKRWLLCFDFSRERFGPLLPLPSHFDPLPYYFVDQSNVVLSSIREEQLAVLYKPWYTEEIEIWVTTKIEPYAVSWTKFLKVDRLKCKTFTGSSFIYQEAKLAVIFKSIFTRGPIYSIACINGENVCFRKVDTGETSLLSADPYVCSYAPNLVQISQDLEPSPIMQKERSTLLTSPFFKSLFVFCIIFFPFIYSLFF